MSKEPRKEIKVEKLELNKETVADLTEEEAEGVQGGQLRRPGIDSDLGCDTVRQISGGCGTL